MAPGVALALATQRWRHRRKDPLTKARTDAATRRIIRKTVRTASGRSRNFTAYYAADRSLAFTGTDKLERPPHFCASISRHPIPAVEHAKARKLDFSLLPLAKVQVHGGGGFIKGR